MIMNPNFEQNYYSRKTTDIYNIGHDSIRIMKWLACYDRSFFEKKLF